MTTESGATMNAGTAALFALFNDQLVVADDLTEGRTSEFSKIAQKYGDFLPKIETDHYRVEVPAEGRSYNALCMYRDASDDQRDVIDRVMSLHDSRHTYRAVMKALLNENRGVRKGGVNLVASVYDNVHAVGGALDAEIADHTFDLLPDSYTQAEGEQRKSMEVVISALIMCASDNTLNKNSMRSYLTENTSRTTDGYPLVHYGDGLLMTFSPEYVKVFSDYSARWVDIASAMQRADRVLTADELEAVATGSQPVPLVEGLL